MKSLKEMIAFSPAVIALLAKDPAGRKTLREGATECQKKVDADRREVDELQAILDRIYAALGEVRA